VQISQLKHQRVALWGWGREGRAAFRALHSHLPSLPLTLFCNQEEAALARSETGAYLNICTEINSKVLANFDVIIKSPGISAYTPEAITVQKNGTKIIGGTQLWFGEQISVDGYLANTICITGTKGKSTTSALLAHLLRSGGYRTALAGNIGLPLLEMLNIQPPADYQVLELSSYQTRDVGASDVRPVIVVVLNLFAEHLDWHGSLQNYIDDKLSLLHEGKPRIAVLNAADPLLRGLNLPHSQIIWFNQENSWHMRDQIVYHASQPILDTKDLLLSGQHNRNNLCAVLAVLDALELETKKLAPAAKYFQPLPHRLQVLGQHDGLTWVNDSISTTPQATQAALDCFIGKNVAVLVGGFDRGLDWQGFAEYVKQHPPQSIITLGANGQRIYTLLKPLADQRYFQLYATENLSQAIQKARTALNKVKNGLILLSPGSPSFDAYHDYVQRGKHFAQLAGFDPENISAISGLGVV